MSTTRDRVGGRSNLLGSVELKSLIQQREIIIEPLLEEEQIDNIGIDLRLDCFFVNS
jgi:deoxycytidine triphosphate deaminase